MYKCNWIPIKATRFVSFNTIVTYPLWRYRVGIVIMNIVLIPQCILFFSLGNVTPGRCTVAAIFHYADNLIHIVEKDFCGKYPIAV